MPLHRHSSPIACRRVPTPQSSVLLASSGVYVFKAASSKIDWRSLRRSVGRSLALMLARSSRESSRDIAGGGASGLVLSRSPNTVMIHSNRIHSISRFPGQKSHKESIHNSCESDSTQHYSGCGNVGRCFACCSLKEGDKKENQ